MITVCIVGAAGWAGRALVAGVLGADDLVLRSTVARTAAGQDLGAALGDQALTCPSAALPRRARMAVRRSGSRPGDAP